MLIKAFKAFGVVQNLYFLTAVILNLLYTLENFTSYIFSSSITNLDLEIVADICWFQLFFGQLAGKWGDILNFN